MDDHKKLIHDNLPELIEKIHPSPIFWALLRRDNIITYDDQQRFTVSTSLLSTVIFTFYLVSLVFCIYLIFYYTEGD